MYRPFSEVAPAYHHRRLAVNSNVELLRRRADTQRSEAPLETNRLRAFLPGCVPEHEPSLGRSVAADVDVDQIARFPGIIDPLEVEAERALPG